MSDNLPSDLLIEILVRLPVKSLVRFTCVSKQWYSLISNPNFISTHLNHSLSISNDNRLLLVKHCKVCNFRQVDHVALRFDNASFDEYAKLQCPVKSVFLYFRIVGCCNGLICLSDDWYTLDDTIIIWNPSVEKSFTIPKFKPLRASLVKCFLGFGFDSLRNDYKVVRIANQINVPNVVQDVEIYSLRAGAWRNLPCDHAPNYAIHDLFHMPTLTNGAFHWVASEKQNKGTFQNLVAAFDMGNEVFREIMVPNDLVKIDVLQLSISVLGTSLALIQYEKILLSDHCWVWVMKDYGMTESWGRLYTIDMREEILRVVGFKKNNEVLCASATRGTGLVSYDPNSREIKNLGIHGLNDRYYVDKYVESLVLLNWRKF